MSSLVHLGRAAADRAHLLTRRDPAAPGGRPLPAPVPARRRRTVADVMTRHPVTVHRSASLWTAWDRLRASRAHHLVVVDDQRRPVGVLDERTIALEWPAGPLAAHRTPVHALLREGVPPRVRGAEDLASAARAVLGSDAEAASVVDQDGRLFGLLTLRHFAELAAGTGEAATTAGNRRGDTAGEGGPGDGARGVRRR